MLFLNFKLPDIENNHTRLQKIVLVRKEKTEGRGIAILVDRVAPYAQLKQVMMSFIAAKYCNISLPILRQDASNKVTGG